MKILLTNSGRRTYFLSYLKNLKLNNIQIFITDTNSFVPTASMVKSKNFFLLPLSSKKTEYSKKLKEILIKKKIDLLIPLSDYDLEILLLLRKDSSVKTFFLVSSPEVINICQNKLNTFKFLLKNGFNTPYVYKNYKSIKKYPVILKLNKGNGSKDMYKVFSQNELKIIKNKSKNYLIQNFINGDEYHIDILNDLSKKFVSCSIKKKISLRGGETDRCQIIKDKDLKDLSIKLSKKIRHIGNLDVDLIKYKNKFYIIDLNPRFGGGYPFTHESGLNYIKFLIFNYLGKNYNLDKKLIKTGVYSKGIDIYHSK